MKKLFYTSIVMLVCSLNFLYAQQYVIADKNNTHPEIKTQEASPAFVTALNAERGIGYNDISWQTAAEDNVRKYIVEYSMDGINFQSAGEVISGKGVYSFRHQMMDPFPALYRIKMEQLNDRFFYSSSILLSGADINPVRIYPTIIQGNSLNVNAYWPIEKIVITTAGGVQVYTQAMNNKRDYISIVLPSLAKGMYWLTSYGKSWKTTSQFIVP
jgi:hypothetical protein